jgi:hypothetical protein
MVATRGSDSRGAVAAMGRGRGPTAAGEPLSGLWPGTCRAAHVVTAGKARVLPRRKPTRGRRGRGAAEFWVVRLRAEPDSTLPGETARSGCI